MSDREEEEIDDLDRLMREYERQAKEDCAKVTRQVPKKQTAEERREEAMSQPLPRENKGHQLLTKMGYSEGKGLGAQGQGRPEPIPLPTKRRREGLGIAVEAKRPTLAPKKEEKEAVTREAAESYRRVVSSRVAARSSEKRLRAARRLIETLDVRKGTERNRFWIVRAALFHKNLHEAWLCGVAQQEEDALEENALENIPVDEALAEALVYLREEHYYCFWCSSQYDGAEDLTTGCPGVKEEDH